MPTKANQKIGQISKDFNLDSINAELDLLHERINDIMEDGDLFLGRRTNEKAVCYMDAGDSYVGNIRTQSAVTVVLPYVSEAYTNRIYMVKDEANIAATYTLTITAQQGEKIDKSQTTTITSNLGVKRFFSTGQEWFTI